MEGFYSIRAGIESAIACGLAYAPYADLVSPSFNWKLHLGGEELGGSSSRPYLPSRRASPPGGCAAVLPVDGHDISVTSTC